MAYTCRFPGILTFKNSQDIRDIAKDMPVDRVLVETDAPYLAPVPNRGKRNEPAFVTSTAETLAQVWEKPVEDVWNKQRPISSSCFQKFHKTYRLMPHE